MMKVYIGPYSNYIGPYQIADMILFWKKKDLFSDNDDDLTFRFGTWLAEKKDGSPSLLAKFCLWVDSKRKRKVEVKIDNYDTWNADQTLALIIVPLLHQLRHDKYDTWNADQTLALIIVPLLHQLRHDKYGYCLVDDKDVPKHLRSTAAPELTEEQKNTGQYDELAEARWNWVLDEMIWAFEQHADDNWEEQYYSGESDLKIVPSQDGQLSELVKGPNDTFKVDEKGKKAHLARMHRGRMLFAKYYSNLWT
jgi:hypothetical protein